MQEHEYVYGYQQRTGRESAQETEQADSLTEQAYEQLANGVDGLLSEGSVEESSSEVEDELALMKDQRASRRLGRILIACLALSFIVSLAAFWLSSTLLSAPDQILPLAFLQMLAANRVLVLCVPVACLVICYFGLRSLTSEIMVVPEHTLDERQKMLRDQAHRSAFKVIKYACVLIPVGFLLPHLPWFNSFAPPSPPVPVGMPFNRVALFGPQGNTVVIFSPGDLLEKHFDGLNPAVTWTSLQAIQPASTFEIALAGGLLLLTLLLMVSALPMAALAWKGDA